MASKTKKVIVGLSGGVDSSVAALLLLEQGYAVEGVFIKAWQPDFLPCTWKEDRQSAMRVAAVLGIPFTTVDLSAEYKRYVFDEMITAYARGETPNPDVACNEYIKFGFFMQHALRQGADFVATGHYAQIQHSNPGGQPLLHTAVDSDKDQSYFLAHIDPAHLSKILFPIGHLTKSQVREKAKERQLPTHNRKDSQGLCFVGHLDMKDFLRKTIPHSQGSVLNEQGVVVGTHDGSVLYTIGERHGFTAATSRASQSPQYVIAKDVTQNTITISEKRIGNTHITMTLRNVRAFAGCVDNQDVLVRYRYRQQLITGTHRLAGSSHVIHIDNAHESPAPGQLVVLYGGEVVLMSGIIDSISESP